MKGREKERERRRGRLLMLCQYYSTDANGGHSNWNWKVGRKRDHRIPRGGKSLEGESWDSLFHGKRRDIQEWQGWRKKKDRITEGGWKVDTMWWKLFQAFSAVYSPVSITRINQYSSSCLNILLLSVFFPLCISNLYYFFAQVKGRSQNVMQRNRADKRRPSLFFCFSGMKKKNTTNQC